MIRLALAVCLATLVAVPGSARAQGGSLADRIAALETKIAGLTEAAVQVPTVAEAARALSEELAQLKQRVDTLEGQQKSIPDAVVVLDRLDVETQRLAQELASLRTEVAGLSQPSDSGGAGGGVRYDRGFRWSTADGAYSLRLDGYAQFRYELVTNEDLDDILDQTLMLRRARVGIAGTLAAPELSYRILAELIGEPVLRDYYVDYAIMGDTLVARAGQYKTPFTRNYSTSSRLLLFPERSLATERFRYDRDVQVGVHGALADGRLGYALTIGNGAGENAVNDNIDVAVAARVDALVVGEGAPSLAYGNPRGVDAPRLQVSAGAVHDLVAVPERIAGYDLVTDVDVDGDRDNVQVISASADALFHVDRLELAVEYMFRHEAWGTILEGQVSDGDDLSDLVGTEDGRNYHSVTGHVAYAVIDDLVVGAGLGYARLPFLGLAGRSSQVPRAARLVQADGLVQLYGAAGRLLGLHYTFFNYNGDGTRPVPDAEKEHRVILEGQLAW